MNWAALTSVFFVATVKFLFSPLSGLALKLSFIETLVSAISGATISSLVFYFAADILLERSRKNNYKKEREALAKGLPFKPKKKFTRANKFIVYLKHKLGKLGICFLAPSLLSIPVGSIIVAKFYGHDKDTFLWIFIGIIISGLISTSFIYLFS